MDTCQTNTDQFELQKFVQTNYLCFRLIMNNKGFEASKSIERPLRM